MNTRSEKQSSLLNLEYLLTSKLQKREFLNVYLYQYLLRLMSLSFYQIGSYSNYIEKLLKAIKRLYKASNIIERNKKVTILAQ